MSEKKLFITDTILRDAHQSQAATRMKLEDMLPACEILDKIGPLPESALLATLCIVLADEVHNRPVPAATDADLKEILARIREIKHKIAQ